MHAFLEVAWYSGARMGGIRALDLGDYDPEEQSLQFHHLPETGTPLKNKYDGERKVGINDHVVECLDTYILRERSDKRDERGREPLSPDDRVGRRSPRSARGAIRAPIPVSGWRARTARSECHVPGRNAQRPASVRHRDPHTASARAQSPGN